MHMTTKITTCERFGACPYGQHKATHIVHLDEERTIGFCDVCAAEAKTLGFRTTPIADAGFGE